MSAVSAQAGEVRAVGNLDLNRYLGTWHEVARYPVIFQRGCTRSKAVYRKIDDRRISVTNSCVRNGKVTEIEGDAIVAGPGKLKVSFFRFLPFRADYWVLYVDKTYSTAVVGGPGRRAAWILSRTPNRSRASLAPALRALERNGYDISAIRFEGKQ
ncbi:MAG: lipocalin family protein [Anaerolineae bacterium]|nr:lipocalin family protein [Anaerolineae bacterium]